MGKRILNLTDEDKAEIIRLYIGEKKTFPEIVEIFKKTKGVTFCPTTASAIVRRQGIKTRRRGAIPETEKIKTKKVLIKSVEKEEPKKENTEENVKKKEPPFLGDGKTGGFRIFKF